MNEKIMLWMTPEERKTLAKLALATGESEITLLRMGLASLKEAVIRDSALYVLDRDKNFKLVVATIPITKVQGNKNPT